MKAIDALKIAREALKERRAYCEQWEYKYGAEWDNEDGYIQDAIEKLAELEKPMNGDAMDVADRIRAICFDETMGYDSFMAESLIKDFAESYHAKKCADCKKARLTD